MMFFLSFFVFPLYFCFLCRRGGGKKSCARLSLSSENRKENSLFSFLFSVPRIL